jgi:hypothetical protein
VSPTVLADCLLADGHGHEECLLSLSRQVGRGGRRSDSSWPFASKHRELILQTRAAPTSIGGGVAATKARVARAKRRFCCAAIRLAGAKSARGGLSRVYSADWLSFELGPAEVLCCEPAHAAEH